MSVLEGQKEGQGSRTVKRETYGPSEKLAQGVPGTACWSKELVFTLSPKEPLDAFKQWMDFICFML